MHPLEDYAKPISCQFDTNSKTLRKSSKWLNVLLHLDIMGEYFETILKGGGTLKLYSSVLDLIGKTPIVKLNKLPDPTGGEVYIKLESFNPGGSVKDRAS